MAKVVTRASSPCLHGQDARATRHLPLSPRAARVRTGHMIAEPPARAQRAMGCGPTPRRTAGSVSGLRQPVASDRSPAVGGTATTVEWGLAPNGFDFWALWLEIGPGAVRNAVSNGFVVSFCITTETPHTHHGDTEARRRLALFGAGSSPRRRGGAEKNRGNGLQLPVARRAVEKGAGSQFLVFSPRSARGTRRTALF